VIPNRNEFSFEAIYSQMYFLSLDYNLMGFNSSVKRYYLCISICNICGLPSLWALLFTAWFVRVMQHGWQQIRCPLQNWQKNGNVGEQLGPES
jgi:hypothetical protein